MDAVKSHVQLARHAIAARSETGARTLTGAQLAAICGVLWLLGVLVYSTNGFHTLGIKRDLGFCLYQAQEVASGGLPYRDVLDVKTPLTCFAFGAALALGRALNLSDLLAARLFSVAIGALVIPLLFLLVLEYWPRKRWAAVAACSFFLFVPYSLQTAMAGQPKVLLAVVLLAFFLAIFRQRWLFTGLLAGLGFCIWQPMLMLFPVAVLASLLGPQDGRLRRALRTAAGFLAPLLVLIAVYWRAQALDDLWLQTMVLPARYLRHAEVSLIGHLRIPTAIAVKHYTAGLPIFALGLAGAAVYHWRLRRREAFRDWLGSGGQVALSLVFFGLAAFSLFDFQGNPDFFPLLIFLPVWAGVLLRPLGLLQRAGKALPLVLAALLAVAGAGLYKVTGVNHLLAPRLQALAQLNAFCPERDVLAIGRPDLLFLAGKHDITRFIVLHDGIDDFVEAREPGGLAGLLASFKQNPPPVVYLSQVDSELTRPLREWVASAYLPTTLTYEGHPFWIRRDLAQRLALARPAVKISPPSPSPAPSPRPHRPSSACPPRRPPRPRR